MWRYCFVITCRDQAQRLHQCRIDRPAVVRWMQPEPHRVIIAPERPADSRRLAGFTHGGEPGQAGGRVQPFRGAEFPRQHANVMASPPGARRGDPLRDPRHVPPLRTVVVHQLGGWPIADRPGDGLAGVLVGRRERQSRHRSRIQAGPKRTQGRQLRRLVEVKTVDNVPIRLRRQRQEALDTAPVGAREYYRTRGKGGANHRRAEVWPTRQGR